MSDTGKCLCGAVEFKLSEKPTSYAACHCNMCRKFSGGIELGVQVMPGGVAWEDEDNIQTFTSSDWAERGFCKTCGSSLFWRLTAPGPMQGMTVISAGLLDSLDGMTFDSEIYIDHKPDSHSFAGERKQMTEAEVMALFGASG